MFSLSRIAGPLAGLLLATPALAQAPTMDALWPNQDGLSWMYAQHYEDYETPQVIDNRTRIFFDGTTIVGNGTQAQYLRQEPIDVAPTAVAFNPGLRDPFLRHLWVARPDLREKILRTTADAPCPDSGATGRLGILLQGELAYRKTSDEVAAWRCDVPNVRVWQWLVSDLTLGNTFTLQLIPDLTDQVFLHGKIAAIEPVTVPAGTYDDCVRVDYVLDFGFSECVDIGGNVTGRFRSETRGSVHYAPGVGPVKTSEDFILHVELIGTCGSTLPVGAPSWHVAVQLESIPTPVRHWTWGQLKIVYR